MDLHDPCGRNSTESWKITDVRDAPHDKPLKLTALRAAADAERWAHRIAIHAAIAKGKS
ncbi:hypothetical protein [Inmirania thermothiophila]|uniref:hypothetical protein n=1 Tax=Inmirania thermothiophila TaxID=1750597 RepID=UPI0014763B00|nr:hypothetical protein [Inmirania thermothiophila]